MKTQLATVLAVLIAVSLALPADVRAQEPSTDSRISTLEAAVATLQAQVAALQSNPLNPYVTVNTEPVNGLAGPHVIFTGVNLHVRSGLESTTDGGGVTVQVVKT